MFALRIKQFIILTGFSLFLVFPYGVFGQVQIPESPVFPKYCLGPWKEVGRGANEFGVGQNYPPDGDGKLINDYNASQAHIVLPNSIGAHQLHTTDNNIPPGSAEPPSNDYALKYKKANWTSWISWNLNGYFFPIFYERQAVFQPGERGTLYCPKIADVVRFSGNPENVNEGGKFSISWSAPFALNCALSGNAPEVGIFSEYFDGANAFISGSKTYDFVKRGIYNFQFECTGYTDNEKLGSAQTTIKKNLTVYAGKIPPAPKVKLSVEPTAIKKGESATLSWTSENADSLSINQGIGIVSPPKGSIKVSPFVTTRYTLTGAGESPEFGGVAIHSVTLRVIIPSIPSPVLPTTTAPIIEIPPEEEAPPPGPESGIAPATEKPLQIDLKINGQDGPLTMAAPASFNLSWNLDKYCLAYGSWLGIKTKAGREQRTENKPGVYTYKLYCPTIGSDEVKVTVSGGVTEKNYVPLPVAEASISLDGKNFSKSVRLIRGKPADLWLGAAYDVNGDRLASRDDNGEWGAALSNGGRCDWNIDLNRGTPVFDGTFKNPQNSESCAVYLGKLIFYDQPGVYNYGVLRLVQNNGKVSNVSYVSIAVQEPPPPKGPPKIDLKINGLDGAVTLGAPAEYDVSWKADNADSCFASGSWGGDKFPSGSQHFAVSEKKEFNYGLTCIGKLGTTTKQILLKVTELPVCEFSALPLTLSKSVFDRQSVLSWKCQFANTCEIAPAVGKVAVFGSARVSPKITTNYTLTCQNLEGSGSFDQVVEVK